MSYEIVNPAALGRPRGWNNGMLATEGGRVLFVAGQIGVGGDGGGAVGRDEAGGAPGLAAQFGAALANVARVVRGAGGVVRGEYVVGWAKRGPSGVIGTNKADAAATVALMREDLGAGLVAGGRGGRGDLADLLRERGVCRVDHEGWNRLDAHETARGKAQDRPRVKLCSVAEMLEVAGRPG